MNTTSNTRQDLVSTNTYDDANDNIQYVPADKWQGVVDFYAAALGKTPQYPSRTEAIFELAGDIELRIIATNESGLFAQKTPNKYINAPTEELFDKAYNTALELKAEVVLKSQIIEVLPVRPHGPHQSRKVRFAIACVRFSSQSLVDTSIELGLTHNPNW